MSILENNFHEKSAFCPFREIRTPRKKVPYGISLLSHVIIYIPVHQTMFPQLHNVGELLCKY